MKRIIASGCSLTYGHGLPDCVNSSDNKRAGEFPSRIAWPGLVANKLKRNCVNLSRPGASNKQIWHSLLNFDYQSTDIVVVYWTFIHRNCSLISSKSINPLHFDIRSSSKESEFYYKHIFTEYDSLLDFYLRVRDTDNYLKSQNVEKIIHMTVENINNTKTWHRRDMDIDEIQAKSSFKIGPKFAKINSLVDRSSIWVDMALDDDHPGIRSHHLFSKQVLKLL